VFCLLPEEHDCGFLACLPFRTELAMTDNPSKKRETKRGKHSR
jgi:hypothetical protein